MSKELIESIIGDNLIEANDIFADRMNHILERKLYENKRMMQVEVVTPVKGKPGEFKGQNTKADWARYRKQMGPNLGTYDTKGPKGEVIKGKPPKTEKTASGGITKHGIEVRRKKGYIQAYHASKIKEFLDKLSHYKKTGEITEEEKTLAALTKQAQSIAKEPNRPRPGAFGMQGKKSGTKIKDTETSYQPDQTAHIQAKAEHERTRDIKKINPASIPKQFKKKEADSTRIARIKASGERLAARNIGSDPLSKLRAWRTKKILKTAGTGLSAIKKGFEAIGQTGGGI